MVAPARAVMLGCECRNEGTSVHIDATTSTRSAAWAGSARSTLRCTATASASAAATSPGCAKNALHMGEQRLERVHDPLLINRTCVAACHDALETSFLEPDAVVSSHTKCEAGLPGRGPLVHELAAIAVRKHAARQDHAGLRLVHGLLACWAGFPLAHGFPYLRQVPPPCPPKVGFGYISVPDLLATQKNMTHRQNARYLLPDRQKLK